MQRSGAAAFLYHIKRKSAMGEDEKNMLFRFMGAITAAGTARL